MPTPISFSIAASSSLLGCTRSIQTAVVDGFRAVIDLTQPVLVDDEGLDHRRISFSRPFVSGRESTCGGETWRRAGSRGAVRPRGHTRRQAMQPNVGSEHGCSGVEAEEQHVAVLHDIFLAFVTRLAGFLGGNFAAQANEIIVGNGLGANEAAFEIGVDDAGGLRRLGALVDRPGARLLGADREIGDRDEAARSLRGSRGRGRARSGPGRPGIPWPRLPAIARLRPRWPPK